MGNIAALLQRHAEERGQQAALLVGRRAVSYAALRDDVALLAGALLRAGLAPGDRVVVLAPMSQRLYTVLLALFWAGAVGVFVDPFMSRPQQEEALRLARPRAFFGSPRAHLLRLRLAGLRGLPLSVSLGHRVPGGRSLRALTAGAAVAEQPAPLPADAPALLAFTSGSTGQPRGVVRSHRLLLEQHRAITRTLGTRSDDVDLAALPVFLLNSLAGGATAVLPAYGARHPAALPPRQLADLIRLHGVTTLAGFPAFYEPLVRWCGARRRRLPSVRAAFVGGAATPLRLLEGLRRVLPCGEPVVVYGSTEAEPISALGADAVLTQTATESAAGGGLCVGHPDSELQLRLDPLYAGAEVGELLLRGPHVNSVYLDPSGRPATAAGPDGWLRTGDCVRQDAAGRLWLQGRRAGVMPRPGRPLLPLAVEAAAEAVRGVQQAALVDVPTAGGVPRAVLWVQPAPGLAAAPLLERVRRHLLAVDLAPDELRPLRRIPTDPRHRAKTDTATLRRRCLPWYRRWRRG